MHDVHIEFAHIYKDQPFSDEQANSLSILNRVIKQFKNENKGVVTSILIDDYHVNKELWSDDYLLQQINQLGYTPDFIAYESLFTDLAEEIVHEIPESHKLVSHFRKDQKDVTFFTDIEHSFALIDHYENKKTPKCVLLSCAWMMARLGLKPFPKESVHPLHGKELESNLIVTILPKTYMQIEENVMKLLSVLGYENEKKRIQYYFY